MIYQTVPLPSSSPAIASVRNSNQYVIGHMYIGHSANINE